MKTFVNRAAAPLLDTNAQVVPVASGPPSPAKPSVGGSMAAKDNPTHMLVDSTTTPSKSQRKFSHELQELALRFANRPVRLQELMDATQGRGFNLLLMVIGLIFLSPIPLLGFSTPFGFVVLIIGARLALGRKPWLPERLLRRELPARFIARVLAASIRVAHWMEVLLRPRLDYLYEQWLYRRIGGTLIMLSGLLLLLPVPIPLTNSFPALTVVLLAAGAMERDGLFFLAGCGAFALTLGYFGLITFGGAHFFDSLWHKIFIS